MQGDSVGSDYKAECQTQSIGDGKCDPTNNLPKCDYDGGDCCRRSCIQHCDYPTSPHLPQFPLLGRTTTCGNACGTRAYDCVETKIGCAECYHGTCKDIEACYEDEGTIKQQLDTCQFDSYTMGNYRTVDMFCGKDQDFAFVHDPYNLVIRT